MRESDRNRKGGGEGKGVNKRFEKKTRLTTISRVLQAFSDGPTNRQTDQPTDRVAYRVACTRLKILHFEEHLTMGN